MCVLVTGGLSGFHDYKGSGGDEVDAAMAKAFAVWAGANGTASLDGGIALYGVINQAHQYTRNQAGEQEWKTMLLRVAQELGFGGPIYGVRITTHVGKADSLYVRFDVAGNDVRISYKRWSKMEKLEGLRIRGRLSGATEGSGKGAEPQHRRVEEDPAVPVRRGG